ncbi:MAG: tetratricopeptide repeat protein [Acidobacteria bacterium]|nr:tetratricopeptide repeat protein [Acidobacteriota bacterium]
MSGRPWCSAEGLTALRLILLIALCTSLTLAACGAETREERVPAALENAHGALMDGHLDDAIRSLQTTLASDPKNGEACLLLCRSYYAEEHEDEAVSACEAAVQAMPRSSEAWDWMGRAYGFKANLTGPVTGFTLARKVKDAFETAVALDPHNGAAVNDLGEFYIKAPAIVGGGNEKAVALAASVRATLPQEAHRIDGLAAEKRKDYGTADREFKAAVAVANRPDAWDDLGAYYIKRGEADAAVEALNKALALDKNKGPSIVDAASLLDQMQREPKIALKAFREYLAGDAKSDAAPVVRADVMLGKLLASDGDVSGAKIEFGDALKLASGYAPARQALQQL